MCWLFLIFNKFLHIIILALDLLKSLKPNAIFFNTFIKLLFPSTKLLLYGLDNVFLIYGKYFF